MTNDNPKDATWQPANHNTMVVCHNPYHLAAVREAFGLNVKYVLFNEEVLTGQRFDKIIIFDPKQISANNLPDLRTYNARLGYFLARAAPGARIIHV